MLSGQFFDVNKNSISSITIYLSWTLFMHIVCLTVDHNFIKLILILIYINDETVKKYCTHYITHGSALHLSILNSI